ncbi:MULTISPECIES: hypothetical protein [unclassified Roseovarius]|uniref:hypothetical protein n=1 Tax=unclassified Roseovarius TaxID=2614913 RepID=UPI00273D6259|nr:MULTISPECIES: hypothetical protein [unclassified Roseovarius]
MSDQTDTPQETLRAATIENAMHQSWATVLGTVVKPEEVRALIRYSSGRIANVTPGDRVGRGTVVAIEDGVVVLTLNGETRKLRVGGV